MFTFMIMNRIFTIYLTFLCFTTYGQRSSDEGTSDKFRSIEIKPKFGSYLYTGSALSDAGLLDAGYGALSIKLGWQSNNTESWSSYYKYPTYGMGLYSAFLGDAQVFGNPNAMYAKTVFKYRF